MDPLDDISGFLESAGNQSGGEPGAMDFDAVNGNDILEPNHIDVPRAYGMARVSWPAGMSLRDVTTPAFTEIRLDPVQSAIPRRRGMVLAALILGGLVVAVRRVMSGH